MSRPFSYNDENFTVIGNVLFVHIIDNKARKPFEPVVEIPPAIFERLKTYTNFCLGSIVDFSDQESLVGSVFTIKNIENKHYLAFAADTLASNDTRLYWSIIFLKIFNEVQKTYYLWHSGY